jgi:hypothetical protein
MRDNEGHRAQAEREDTTRATSLIVLRHTYMYSITPVYKSRNALSDCANVAQ